MLPTCTVDTAYVQENKKTKKKRHSWVVKVRVRGLGTINIALVLMTFAGCIINRSTGRCHGEQETITGENGYRSKRRFKQDVSTVRLTMFNLRHVFIP